MTALTIPLPGNESRTRTQAIAVTGTAALVANHLHHDSGAVVEEAVLNRLPSTQPQSLGVDREQALRLLEAILRAARDRFEHWPVTGIAEELLRLRRPQELQKGL